MKKWFVLAALLLTGAAHAAAPATEEPGLEQSADMLLVGIPVVALGLTFLIQDSPDPGAAPAASLMGFDLVRMTGAPRHDLGLALLRTGAITYGLKYAVDEERPNGETGSFPSGHTSVTFAGAEFIRKEYGWHWGAPAYAAATFVGWSRVATEDHWWHDVAVGAAIGVLSNHDLSEIATPLGGVSLQPALFQAVPPDAELIGEGPSAAPGLKLELRF